VIVTLWHRWRLDRNWWWLALLAGVMLLDVVIGSWLIAQELRVFKEVWK